MLLKYILKELYKYFTNISCYSSRLFFSENWIWFINHYFQALNYFVSDRTVRKGYKQDQTSKEGETVLSEICDHVRSKESSYISGYWSSR